MAKPFSSKRIFKIGIGVIIFFTLPSVLFFSIFYLTYHENLPVGKQGIEADQLATKMLNSLDYDAYKATDYIEWTFKGKHHYKWYKTQKRCEVFWDHFKVDLDLQQLNNSKVYVADQHYEGIEKQDYIKKAEAYFNNDSFWLVAPYKVFDLGVKRSIVTTEQGDKALLVTYTSGGTTPGDSYLWHLDTNGKPVSYQMWVDILPVGGLKATWDNWTTTKSGAQLPTTHKLLFLDLDMGKVVGVKM